MYERAEGVSELAKRGGARRDSTPKGRNDVENAGGSLVGMIVSRWWKSGRVDLEGRGHAPSVN